jgi:hypothetical protein
MHLSYQRHYRQAHGQHGGAHHGHLFRVGDAPPAVVSAQVQEAIKPLTGFGWEWRADGVILTLTIDGTPIRVFAPLAMIWEAIHHELTAIGCPMQSGVGEPLSVGSLFGSIVHAVSSVVTAPVHAVAAVAKAVAPAIKKAANVVVKKASTWGKAAINSKIIRYGLDAAAVVVPALAPAAVALEAAHQALSAVNDGIAAAKEIKAGVTTAANTAKAVIGLKTQQAVAQIVDKAKAADPRAQQFVGALQQLALTRGAAAAPNPRGFLAAAMAHAPQLAVHQGALFSIAKVATDARAHALKPYRVHTRAA